ncbi:MAG: sel1 repeat family protein, partial [Candidatus Competibacteraceae bacterium]|nr:sel1 repeat family protein [Candidatus Competibacteraceae bacterium]
HFNKLLKLAEAGDPWAQYNVGNMYFGGYLYSSEEDFKNNYETDIKKCSHWLEKAARQGFVAAVDNLVVVGVGPEAERLREISHNRGQTTIIRTPKTPRLIARMASPLLRKRFSILAVAYLGVSTPQKRLRGTALTWQSRVSERNRYTYCMNRTRTVVCRMSDTRRDEAVPGTPAQRIGLVWPLTREVASLSKRHDVERRLQRHVTSLGRREG